MEWSAEIWKECLAVGIGGLVVYFKKDILPFFKKLYGKTLRNKIDELEIRMDISENLFYALLEIDDRAIFVNDENAEVAYVNPAWLTLTGMPNLESAKGHGYMSVIPKEDRDLIEQMYQSHQRHPTTRFDGNIRFQKYKTTIITEYYCRSLPITDYKNHVKKTIGRIYIIENI